MAAEVTVFNTRNYTNPAAFGPIANAKENATTFVTSPSGAGGPVTIYKKRAVYAPLNTPTSLITWQGTTAVIDGSDQSQVPSGDLLDIGIYDVITVS